MNDLEKIQKKIYEIRGQRVMLDRDLAELYGVTTGALNQAVKRNKERFPEDFMFQLTRIEFDFIKSNFQKSKSADIQKDDVLISQFVISKPIERRGGSQKLPYAFTEQGVAMLSSVLHSSLAIKVNVDIMRAFVYSYLSSHLQINGCKARDAIAQSTRGICRTGGLLADRPIADS